MHKHQPRLFIGLDLCAKDKLELDAWRHKYLAGLPDKPVPMENFHITLSFLGQVESHKMEFLEQQLNQIKHKLFQLEATEMGCFIKAQVLYLAVTKPPLLEQLAEKCGQLNKALGLPQHHNKYRPHITLFRKHKGATPLMLQPPKLELKFNQFHLYESVSSHIAGKPPHYVKRFSFDLLPF